LFKTDNGYLLSNKESNKVYVPYQNELRPVPFNPYTNVSEIPEYVYLDVVPYSENQFYIKKGNYYYAPYKNHFYSWKSKNKKDIKHLKNRVSELERKTNASQYYSRSLNEVIDDKPIVRIDNNINVDKLPVIKSEPTINERSMNIAPNNLIHYHPKNESNRIPQAESKVESKIVPQAESKVESIRIPQAESKVEPKIVPQAESKVESKIVPQAESKVEPKIVPQAESKVEPKSNELENIPQDESDKSIQIAKDVLNDQNIDLSKPKETFWSKFGF
jgi:hypothetical protein